jgi:hypothetical protein
MNVRRLAVVSLTAALSVAGCGRADDRQVVAEVTERFLDAVSDSNGTRACAQLSEGAQQALEQDQSKPCPEAARELEGEIESSRVARADVFATTAKVDLKDGQSAFLELTSHGWRLAAAGCRPAAGGEEPYDCEVEA